MLVPSLLTIERWRQNEMKVSQFAKNNPPDNLCWQHPRSQSWLKSLQQIVVPSEDECTNGELNEIEGAFNPSAYCWTSFTECTGWFGDPVTMILTLSQRLTNIHGHVVSSNIQHWMHFLSLNNRFWHLKKWLNDYTLVFHSWTIVNKGTICWPLTATGYNWARVQADVGEGIWELMMVVEAKVGTWIGWDGLPVRHQYHSSHSTENSKNGNDTVVQFKSLQQ